MQVRRTYVKTTWVPRYNNAQNEDWSCVRIAARQSVGHLVDKRKDIIKNSLYKTHLKDKLTRSEENLCMSNYIESRREFWIQPAIRSEHFTTSFQLE